MEKKVTKVITSKKVRWSYVNVWQPKADENGGTPKYSISLIIDKSDKETIDKVRAAIQAAYEEGEAKLKGNAGKAPSLKSIHNPLRDGDEKGDPAYQGCYFLNAKSNTRPGILDANGQPIMDQEEVYPGCYGRASITFFAYNHNGNKGIGVALNNLMKISEGERLGGKASAEDDFSEFYGEDDEGDSFLD